MYRAHDLITQVPTDVPYEFAFANIADAHAPGIELEAEATVRELHLLGSYTYQDVRTDAERRISNSPRNMVRSRVTGPVVPNRLFFGVEGLYTGDRDTLAGTVADGAFLGNVTLSSRQIAGATLTFAVGNLFNEKYADPGAEEHPGNIVQQVGRTMRAQVSWRF
jgi:outer membrane receptor protein involved in Fe transport